MADNDGAAEVLVWACRLEAEVVVDRLTVEDIAGLPTVGAEAAADSG